MELLKRLFRKLPYRHRKQIHLWIKYLWLFRRAKNPQKQFIIYGCGRSGSTLLTSLLNSHPDIFADGEVFHELRVPQNIRFPKLYLLNLSKKATIYGKKVYGCGIMSRHLDDQKNIDHASFINWLHKRGWYIIHLRRRNVLNLVISRNIAKRDKVWEVKKINSQKRPERQVLDMDETKRMVWLHKRMYKTEDEVLEKVPNKKIYYEDQLEYNDNWDSVVNEIVKELGLPPYKPNTLHVKKSRGIPKDYILNYNEIVTMLNTEGLGDFIY